jgi:hypothetical protein
MVRKPVLSLGVSSPTVMNHLSQDLGMKCYHSRWIPHVLDDSQKAEKVHCIRLMLESLDVHIRMNDEYLITGDESWKISGQMPSRM